MSPALLFVIFVLGTAALAHFLAASRLPAADCGGYWAQVLDRLCIWLALPLLIVSSFHTLDAVQRRLPATLSSWLIIAGAGWLIILAAGLIRVPPVEEGRWIAGTLEFSPYRFWIGLLALPFLPALWSIAPSGGDEIFAAHWGVTISFLVTLGALALSASPTVAWSGMGAPGEGEQPVALSPWPDEMRSRGAGVQPIANWQASPAPEPVSGVAAEWQRRLAAVGSGWVSGVLCQAVSQLVAWAPQQNERVAIALGPDQCGQEEITALMATDLSRRYGESTLVVTAGSHGPLAERLGRWLTALGGENPARLVDLAADAGSTAGGELLLVDAETLSDSVLDELRGELQRYGDGDASARRLGRIGMVVWWNAHEFSGVLAAHVWAVSRRLERLLRSRRGASARAVVFARRPREREVAFVAFLEHLLPYPLKNNQFQIPSDFARDTFLYRLEDESPAATARAVEASLLTDWPTLPSSESDLPAVPPHPPADSAAAAGARILEVKPVELLSLREMICQGGRSSLPGIVHHVAVPVSDNPYMDFLLLRYHEQQDAGASVHLVSAEGHPELVRRHLLLALREVPDTLTGVRESFHWEEDMLRNTLRRLSDEDRLSRVPVRFLDADGRLQRDSLYANQNPGQSGIRSFRIVGRSHPVELRDPNVVNRLLAQVDPERLPIEAYPMRIFESHGRRYRVQPWSGATPDRIVCRPEESDIRTWRFTTSRIHSIKRFGESLTFRGMERYTARVQYQEDVTGVLERNREGGFQAIGYEPVRANFETEALIIEFTDAFSSGELVSAAAALRHVLPVHAAVEDDALQVVPFQDRQRRGLALVDLYPGGIGVVNAIHKTVWLVPKLFDEIAQWLSQPESRAGLSKSPLVRAMGIGGLDIKGALRIFTSAAAQRR